MKSFLEQLTPVTALLLMMVDRAVAAWVAVGFFAAGHMVGAGFVAVPDPDRALVLAGTVLIPIAARWLWLGVTENLTRDDPS